MGAKVVSAHRAITILTTAPAMTIIKTMMTMMVMMMMMTNLLSPPIYHYLNHCTLWIIRMMMMMVMMVYPWSYDFLNNFAGHHDNENDDYD